VLHPNSQVRAADLPARYRAGGAELPVEPPSPLRDAVAVPPVAERPLQTPATTPAADAATLSPRATLPPEGLDLKSHMAELELELIQAALQQANGVVAHAAPLLGLRRTTLVEKLRKYGIDRDSD
jgi:sigma-54 specific flagellar transcriptional regulator A